MAISRMKKVTLAVLSSERENLINHLQSLNIVHVDSFEDVVSEETNVSSEWYQDLDSNFLDLSTLESQKKSIQSALHFLAEHSKKPLPTFEITLFEVIEKVVAKHDLLVLTENLSQLEQQTKDAQHQVSLLEQELKEIKKWSIVVDNFDPIHGKCSTLRGVLGSIAETALFDLKEALSSETDLSDVLETWSENKEVFCYVVAEKSVWERVQSVLKEKPFNTIQVTQHSGDIGKIIVDLENEISKYRQKFELSMKEWARYETQISDLAMIHDVLEMKIQRMKASTLVLQTDNVSFLRLWVPEDDLPRVEAVVSIYEKFVDLTVEDPLKDEYPVVPVLLRNNPFLEPFSVLTNMYGTPMYGATVDPTPHLSLFYFIYYGICLGDALYGLLMFTFSLLMMFRNRANAKVYNFYALLVFSGLSAVISGVIFGSYAGNLFDTYLSIPLFSQFRFFYPDGMSFFDKPLFVLFISLLLGAIQLFYGYLIKFFIALKENVFEAICNETPWLILLSGFFSWAVFSWIASMAGLNLVSAAMNKIFFFLIGLGVSLVLLNSMRKGFQKSILAGLLGPLSGAWELYGLSGYLSSLLSYARLLALGLSSGIIANVFNELSFSVINSLVQISPFLMGLGIFMLAFLHLFNLVLGGFGAFVHALRLQFVEFFGQFIQGGGKDFKPLESKGTHYIVK